MRELACSVVEDEEFKSPFASSVSFVEERVVTVPYLSYDGCANMMLRKAISFSVFFHDFGFGGAMGLLWDGYHVGNG